MNSYHKDHIQVIVNDCLTLVKMGHDIATHINDDIAYEGIHCTYNSEIDFATALIRMSDDQVRNFQNDIEEVLEEVSIMHCPE